VTGKRRSVALLVIAEIAAMVLWFVSAAVLDSLTTARELSVGIGAALTSSISAGFVVGALLIAITGVADRFDPRRIFAASAVLAAVFNAGVLIGDAGAITLIVLRFLVGVFLAGVYPVGMKIVVGWGTDDRGWLVGLVVGGLTLGTAMPHLLAFAGGADWRVVCILASVLGLISAVLVLFVQLGPHHSTSPRFRFGAILLAWRDRRIRLAIGGYLGHMWELYAMWAWIGTALAVSYAMQMEAESASSLARLTAFIAIAAGALACPPAGYVADRIGKAQTTIAIMAMSAAAAVATAMAFGGPVWLVFGCAVFWGVTVIPDSAQFSALIADYAPAELAGSILTLQTALGFTLTIATVQFFPMVVDHAGWSFALGLLAAGPVAGIAAMWTLRR